MTDDEPDLADFGASANVEPPLVERRYIEQSPHTGKIAGFLGHEKRRGLDVYTTLRSKSHYYNKGGGWAISDVILDDVARIDATLIFVHDGTDADDDVYEFRAEDYIKYGHAVPAADLDDPDDTQTYVPGEEAIRVWEGHAADLFVRPFKEACERIGWKGYNPDLKRRKQRQ